MRADPLTTRRRPAWRAGHNSTRHGRGFSWRSSRNVPSRVGDRHRAADGVARQQIDAKFYRRRKEYGGMKIDKAT